MRPSPARRPRVVLITGATSGIGKALALKTAAAGDHVVLVSRGRAPLDRTARECLEAGAASTHVHVVDVGDDDRVAAVVEHTVAELGRLDAVVSCAGVVAYGRTEEVPAAVFEGVLRTNVLGAVNVARHTVPVLRRQGSGSLLLVGSVLGHLAAPSMSPYVLSKWAVRALARQLQIENRDVPGVGISHIAPGGVDTPIYARAANYHGVPGRPPPPMAGPDHVADVLVARIDRPRARTQVGAANGIMRAGFTLLPTVYDALVGPLFSVLATAPGPPVEPTSGNVLEVGDQSHATRHGHPGILRSLGRRAAVRVGTGKGGRT